ncbi:MAG: nucleoside kinase [Bacilli bacterium]|nr:nucleoside kinase [Bacilli bacterium]
MEFTLHYLGKTEKFSKKVMLSDLIENENQDRKYICAKVNNKVRELTYQVSYDADIQFLTLADNAAKSAYEPSLRYVIAMAFHNCYPDLKIKFTFNVSRTIGVFLTGSKQVANTAMLIRIRHEIDRIIQEDYPLKRIIVPNDEAARIYDKWGYQDKSDVLQYRPEKTVHLYECDGYLNYMYARMVPSTGYLKSYKIRLYTPGFLVSYPRPECGGQIPEFNESPTYGRTLRESHDWAKIVGVDTVSRINNEIIVGGSSEFINICEARHNRMLAELGQLIEDDISNIRLICVAGPSSSGKTTFANRLRVELLSRGIKPIRISLDDYYLRNDQVPLNEKGEPDLEHIEALDIELFNQNMSDLINGEEVTLPKFDFKTGTRVPGRTLKVGKDEPILIEGIHALNDRMTDSIPKANKFKIFISPQGQVNLDNHNPVSITDLRLIRRMVRDYQFRNSPAEETFSMWAGVRAGEFKWIYPTQEGCDYVFNSYLAYELPCLKKYAVPLLQNISKDSPYFLDAERLLHMLKFFVDMEDKWVPSNSLMREFIGGSCYEE